MGKNFFLKFWILLIFIKKKGTCLITQIELLIEESSSLL